MNPVKITLFVLVGWIILTILYVFNFVEDVSEKPFEVAMYSFYLSPFVCIIAFATSLFFYRSWIINNRIVITIFSLILIIWSFLIILYIKSLFQLDKRVNAKFGIMDGCYQKCNMQMFTQLCALSTTNKLHNYP